MHSPRNFMTSRAALLLVNLQVGIFSGGDGPRQSRADRRLAELCARANRLARVFARSGEPVIVIQYDGGPGHRLQHGAPGWSLRPEIAGLEGAVVVRKSSVDSFFETDLERVLRALAVDTVYVAGGRTDYCIDAACRSALAQGFNVALISDAHGTVDGVVEAETIQAHHNAILDGLTRGRFRIMTRTTAEVCASEALGWTGAA